MKLIIDIPEEVYDALKGITENVGSLDPYSLADIIVNRSKPIDNLISRDALIEAIEDLYEYAEIDEVIDVIKKFPTVEESPEGKWIEGKNGTIKCNKCGCEIKYSYLIGNEPNFPKYCCDCGAKMKGG